MILMLHAVWGGALSARTPEQLTEDITDRDRQITELRGQVERLRYVAGDSIARQGIPSGRGADHDLLLELSTTLRLGFEQIGIDRLATRETIEAQNRLIALDRADIDSLKMSWAKAIGYAMGVSGLMSVALKLLWK